MVSISLEVVIELDSITPAMASTVSQGVYILGNDRIYPWAVAFLESFRHYNPDLPLRLIPFDEKSDRIKALAQQYGATIHEDEAAYQRLEQIGHLVGRDIVSFGHHWFRRLAAFWGPLDEFIYLDARIVVVSDLQPWLDARRRCGADLLYYDRAVDQVYLPCAWRDQLLINRRPAGFMSGLWVSRKGLFSLDDFEQLAKQSEEVTDGLNRRNSDQCFLNYCCDARQITYAPIYRVIPHLARMTWSRQPGLYRYKQSYFIWEHGGLEHNKQMPVINWAGTKLSPAMPYAAIFLCFALKRQPLAKRLLTKLWWRLQYPPLKMLDMLRRSRWLNTGYHLVRHKYLGTPLPERLQNLDHAS